MKITKFKRALSVLLVAVMIISTLPLNAMGLDEMERSTRPADSTNNIFEDLFWELIKPFIKPKVTVKGLPENAEGGIEIVTDPFSSKAKSSLGTFLDFYDIKAKDKTTGEIVHPEGEVEVTIKDARIKQNQSVFLIHVLDDENVIKNADNVTLVTEAAFVSAFKDAAKAAENALGVSGAVAVEIIDDLTIDGRDITFKTSSFSIFILANNPRLNVRFYNGSTLINTIVVKFADRNSLNTLIYDQPIDTSNSAGVMFRGWSEDPNYTDPDTAKTIKQVRAYVKDYLDETGGNFADGTNLDFYAMLFKQFVVTYFDERGVVCLGRDTFLYRADGADGAIGQDGTIDYRINMSYLPSNEGQAFLGWTINPGRNLAGEDETPVYEYENYRENLVSVKPEGSSTYTTTIPDIIDNPIPAKIKGDVYLKAVAPVGNWLVFEENGKGAKYNAPQFVETNQPTQRPCPDAEMTRIGYTFGGWYYSKQIPNPEYTEGSNKPQMLTVIDETRPFTFGGTITEKTTIFAKWNENITAEYTIIIWKQNINGDTVKSKYDFAQSIHLSGNVGDTINVTQNGVGISIPGASFYTVTSSTSDGRYTIVDDNGNYVTNQQLYYNNGRWWKTRTQTSGGCGGTQYEYSNEYTGIVYNNQTSNTLLVSGFHYDSHDENVTIATEGNSVVNVYFNRNEYTLTFQASINNRWQTIKTITALYQQDISSEFPIHGNNGVDYTGYVWEPQNSAIYTTGDVPYIEAMREENTVFHAKRYGTGAMVHMYYYVESLPGHNGDVTYDGKNFDLHQHVQISSRGDGISSTLKEDFSNISGFTQYASNPAYGDDGTVSLNSGNQYTIKFYYTRDRFDISYFDGGYFDGNGNLIDEVLQGKFDTEYGKQILYNDDIVNYNKAGTVVGEGQAARTSDGSNYFEPEREGYVFEGWYVDDRCSSPYTFDTMNGAVKVYAKWRQIQYRVFLIPDTSVGEGKTASQVVTVDPENGLWGTLSQELNFRISYGDKVSLPTGIDANHVYEFGGWYLDPEYKHPFSGNEKLNNSLTDYFKEYNKNVDFTDDMDAWGHGATWNSDTRDAQGNPRNRFWITEKLELYALWRRVLDGADGVKVIYDYATDEVDDEDPTTYDSSSTIAFSDNHIYEDRALSYGAAAPAPITVGEGEDAVTYYFRYWVRQEWVESEGKYSPAVILGEEPTGISDARKIYPGESFRVDSQYARRIDHGETSEYFVHFVAVYTEAEAPVVDVKYDRNATDAVWSIGSEVEAYKDNNNESVYYKKYTDDQYGFAIEINKEFSILKNENYLTRTGYKFLGWAFDKNMSAETFKSTLATETAQGSGNRTVFAGGEGGVAADDLDTPNSSKNTLYAIWEINRYDVEVDKVLVNKGVDDDTWNAHPFTVHYKYELEGYDTVEGTLTVKANDTTLPMIQNIPHGAKLTVWEVLDTNDAKIFTTDHDASSKYEITSVTAEKDGDLAATVTITNTRKDVDLYIRKFVDLDKDAGNAFKFNVTVTNGTYEGTSPVTVTSAKTGTEATGTKITVPYGSTVTISEITTDTYETYNGTPYTVADIFDTTGAADWTVTATEEQTHDFTNVRKTVKIYVKKDVVDSLDPADRDYLFKFTINGEERSAKAGDTTEPVVVPIGTEVTVVETDKNGNYITEWAIYGSEETKTVSDTANIGQRYGDTTVIFTNTREKVPLTITKTVDKDVDNGKEFYFDVTINDTTEKKTVKGGESITINVMYGAPVSVTERISDEYNGTGYTVAQLFKTDAAKSADHLTTATEWTFNNVRRVGTLTVTKEVVSDYAPDYTTKEYKFTYTVNGGTAVPFSITINGDKTNTYTIPVEFFVGDVVVVTEDDLHDAYMTQSDAVTVTIAEGDGNAAKITNTRKDVTVTVIKKLAEEDSFNTDKVFTFSVGNGVENQTATVGGENAAFTLTYGTEFTLEEIGLDAKYDTPTFETTAGASVLTGSNGSYTAMGDGEITVTNKVKRIPVVVKKTVNGDAEDKAADYNFTVSSSIGSVTSDAEGKTAITTLVIKGDNEKTVYVPYGATLMATETGGGVDGREYKTTINGVETKTHTTDTLTAEGTTIEFVNTRIVTVTVVKAVPDGDEALVGTDTFEVTVVGDNVANNDKSFNISLTQNMTFKVPYNSTFTVTESLGDLAWKYQTPEYSGGSNSYTATADTTVTITNKLQTYKVKVIKSVSDPNYYANGTKFYFDQTGLPTDNPFTLGLGRDGEDPNSVEFTVKAGTVVTVKERPGDETKSTTFTLTTGVISTSSEYPSFTVKQDTEVEFTNVINVYPVTVKKEIDNSALDPSFAGLTDNFKLEYEVYDANGVKITEVKGDDAVDLKPGVNTVIPNVPYGGYVKVNEISDDRYTTTYKSGDKTDGTCAEVKNDQTVITVTNTRKATSLTIEKKVDSTVEADKETREYVFTVMIGTVKKTVTISGEGTETLPMLPVGESVAVTEAEQANMDTTFEHVLYTLAENAESNKSTFTNKRRVVTITVEKTVVSRVKADYGKDYTFSYEYTVDHKYEGTATISIAAKPDNADTMNGTTTISVPEGATAFKLTEDPVDANLTVTHSNNEIAGPITTSPAKVTVTNERPEIAVTIEKVVVSDINDYSNYDFKFDYTVKFGNQTVESGTKSITGAGTNNEITVPKGADITVTEQTGVKYTTINNADFTVAQVFDTTYSSDTLTGVVAEGGKITVTNTRKLVEVTVKKVVDNKWNIASDLEKEFSFNFDSAKMYTGADYATVITSADTKKLKHDGEIKIKVPFGATFTATETEDPAFDTTVKIGSTDAVKALSATTAQLTADGTVITFTNTRKPIKVEVQKHVNKFFDEDIDEKFYFEAAVMFGGSAWALPTADRAFDLMDYLTDNTRKHVFEVPYGSNIQVKEVNHTGFTSSATLNGEDYDQNMTATPLTQDATVIIKNDRDRVTITVTKTVATDAKLKTVDEAINFPFTYSWTKNENFKRDATSFPLKHGQEYTFTVPVGAAVNVNELTDTELTVYNNLKISDVFATVSEYGTTTDDQTVSFNADAATTVAFTNTHKTVKVNLVKAVNLEQDKNVNFEFTWSAVYGTGENAIDFTTDNGTATRNHNTTATLLCTVPVGVKISVTEILPSEQGFVTPNIAYTTGAVGTVDGAVVTISDIKADATITYTNSRQVFDITFGKKVVNGVANDNEFPFRFTYTDNGGEEHEVFISDNGSITIPKVPYGHTIVITEDVLNQLSAYGNFKVADIFATAISGQSGNCTVDGAKVTITVKKDENITFTNTHKTSTVTITKTVESKNESDKQHEFPFSATAHAGNTYVIGSADEKDSFSLKHTGTKVYTVPYGFEFTVGEEPDTRYNTSIKFDGTSEAAQVKSFTAAKDAYTIAYLNERAQGDLKIVKTGVGETTDAFLFKVTKNNDTTFKPLFVTIHGNGSVYVMQLEAGDYLVEEVTDWSWRYDKQTEEITNEADGADKTDNMATIMGGETGDEAPTVTFTNKKNNKNWLGTECGGDNKYDPQLTAAVDPAAEQVAWDSKIRLAYASPADKFRDNKETA